MIISKREYHRLFSSIPPFLSRRTQIALDCLLPPPTPLYPPLHREANGADARSRRLPPQSMHRISVPSVRRRSRHALVLVQAVPARRRTGPSPPGEGGYHRGKIRANATERLGLLRHPPPPSALDRREAIQGEIAASRKSRRTGQGASAESPRHGILPEDRRPCTSAVRGF